jgi:predicted nuclease of predicted toxin-antitoxin system
MQVAFLLDEIIAAPLAAKLDKAGHDVERVVDVSELGEGVDDTTIGRYAVQEGRLIVTSDDDFVQLPADSHSGVFYKK